MKELLEEAVTEFTSYSIPIRVLIIASLIDMVRSAVKLLRIYLIKRSQHVFDQKLAALTALSKQAHTQQEFMVALGKVDRLTHLADGNEQHMDLMRVAGYLHGRYQAYYPDTKRWSGKQFLTRDLPQSVN